MKKTTITIGAILVIVVIGIVIWMTNQNTSPPTTNTTPSSSSNTTATPSTITYSSDGFSPATLTVKSGATVTIKNTSDEDLQFESNPHPAHTDDTDLNVGLVAAGQTKTFTVTKTGTFGYHNHLDPSDTGHIVVE
jgi:plastocyanin